MQKVEPLATRREVADYLRVSVSTLHMWAHQGRGPRYTLAGGSARYDWSDVKTWLATQPVGGTVAA